MKWRRLFGAQSLVLDSCFSPARLSSCCSVAHCYHSESAPHLRAAFRLSLPQLARNKLCSASVPSTKVHLTHFIPRHMSSVHKPIVAKFTEEIDIEKLRKELRQERKDGSEKEASLAKKIKEAVAEKCDEAVAKLSEEETKQLKIIQLEHDFLYSEGYEIMHPDEMTNEHWLEALNLTTRLSRLKYYLFLQKKAILKANQKEKQRAPKEHVESRFKAYEHGTLFMRIYQSTMRRWGSYRLASSMQFGIPLVFDMDFQDEMSNREIRGTASQLVDVYGHNRSDRGTPFHLHFTNCSEDNSMYKLFQLYLQDTEHVLVSQSNKSYLDIFDKRDLIYLSPNGRQVMREFDPTAVYILGAYNDSSHSKPVTYARATEQGIRCQRLPLDEHLNWTLGRKALTLDQVLRILQTVKNNESWRDAFKFVPQRKVTRRD